ncbi:Plasma membrane t-SNARE, secretory vesicle fusion [Cladochytrium tenue]|nr:Plasma membrane t-SNARE, secretory vesicle fusion [Cladochytrium tenue]
MSRSRLAQIQQQQQQQQQLPPNLSGGYDDDDEYSRPLLRGTPNSMTNAAASVTGSPEAILARPAETMADFLTQADALTGINRRVSANAAELVSVNTAMLNEVNPGLVAESRRRQERLLGETGDLIRQARRGLDVLRASRRGDVAVRQQHYRRCAESLQAGVQAFHAAESAVRAAGRDQLARQYRIVRPDASEAEVAAVLDRPGGTGEDLFAIAALSPRAAASQRALSEVQSRHAELEKLAASMTELAELAADLRRLISEQQVMIDETEQHVEETVIAVEKGNVMLTTANTSAASARRTQWIILGIVLAVLLVIIIAIVAAVEAHKSSG